MYKITLIRTILLLLVVLVSGTTVFAALAKVNLGSGNFAVVAGSTITNTGSSVINGDLGLSPGTAVTGFPPGTLNGTKHAGDATASQAQTDLTNAYTDAMGRTPVTTIPTELGGTVLKSGVYSSASGTLGLTGTVTLDGEGDPNAVFIFKTSSTLITAGTSQIVLTGGAQACNVFWQVGSSATLGVNSTFRGNILALTSVTLTTGAKVDGGVFARNGAVTLDSNIINRATCASPTSSPTPVATTTASTTPIATSTSVATSTVTATTPVATTTPVTITTAITTPAVIAQVTIPTLPNTGYEPDSRNLVWDATLAFGGIVALFLLYTLRKKYTV